MYKRQAPDGATALTIIRAWQPEAIVLDVTMPVIDGISLIALVRKFSQAPILLLTARGGLRDRIAGLKAGADDYLVKPFDLAELSERCLLYTSSSLIWTAARVLISGPPQYTFGHVREMIAMSTPASSIAAMRIS